MVKTLKLNDRNEIRTEYKVNDILLCFEKSRGTKYEYKVRSNCRRGLFNHLVDSNSLPLIWLNVTKRVFHLYVKWLRSKDGRFIARAELDRKLGR